MIPTPSLSRMAVLISELEEDGMTCLHTIVLVVWEVLEVAGCVFEEEQVELLIPRDIYLGTRSCLCLVIADTFK